MTFLGRGSSWLRRLDAICGVPLLVILALLRRTRKFPKSPRTIALLQTVAIGDTVLMSAAVKDLRELQPTAKIVVFAGPSNVEAARLLPAIDQVIPIRPLRPLKAILTMRRYRPDILIDFGPWPRLNGILTAFVSAFTIGYKTPGQFRHYAYDTVVRHSDRCHEIDNQRNLIRGIGGRGSADPDLQFNGCGAQSTRIPEGKYAVVHPWASGTGKILKQWSNSNWIDVIRWLADHGYAAVVTGAIADRLASERLIANASAICPDADLVNIAGDISLEETCAVIDNSSLLVSVNTGIMHIGAILGVPTIGLHGPTAPHRWGPVGSNARAIYPRSELCGYLHLGFEFPADPPDCMNRISSDLVIHAVAEFLNVRIDG